MDARETASPCRVAVLTEGILAHGLTSPRITPSGVSPGLITRAGDSPSAQARPRTNQVSPWVSCSLQPALFELVFDNLSWVSAIRTLSKAVGQYHQCQAFRVDSPYSRRKSSTPPIWPNSDG